MNTYQLYGSAAWGRQGFGHPLACYGRAVLATIEYELYGDYWDD